MDAILETGGCERFDGEVFSLFERRLRAEIGWYVSVGSSTGVLIWDKDSDGRLSARSRHWLKEHKAALHPLLLEGHLKSFCVTEVSYISQSSAGACHG